MNTDIKLSQETLDIQSCIQFVSGPESGGIDVFIGTVRNRTNNREVIRLEFEAFDRMALTEMNRIAAEALNRWPTHKISLHHRTGVLRPGEAAVVIAVSAAHRAAAFEACRFMIDRLKETVPIWKKEIFADGEVWVAAHP